MARPVRNDLQPRGWRRSTSRASAAESERHGGRRPCAGGPRPSSSGKLRGQRLASRASRSAAGSSCGRTQSKNASRLLREQRRVAAGPGTRSTTCHEQHQQRRRQPAPARPGAASGGAAAGASSSATEPATVKVRRKWRKTRKARTRIRPGEASSEQRAMRRRGDPALVTVGVVVSEGRRQRRTVPVPRRQCAARRFQRGGTCGRSPAGPSGAAPPAWRRAGVAPARRTCPGWTMAASCATGLCRKARNGFG